MLSLRRKPGPNQLKYETAPKIESKAWRQAREVSRALANNSEKGDIVSCTLAESLGEKVFLISWGKNNKIYETFAEAPLALLLQVYKV